jgi:hypothetical protein
VTAEEGTAASAAAEHAGLRPVLALLDVRGDVELPVDAPRFEAHRDRDPGAGGSLGTSISTYSP